VRCSDSSPDVGEFDLPALRKVRQQKEADKIKDRIYLGGYESVHANTSATDPPLQAARTFTSSVADTEHQTIASGVKRFACATDGSEVEVDGGVALTEEAIETHTPDILAIDVLGMKRATTVQDV
jgi:hypothetical protein